MKLHNLLWVGIVVGVLSGWLYQSRIAAVAVGPAWPIVIGYDRKTSGPAPQQGAAVDRSGVPYRSWGGSSGR